MRKVATPEPEGFEEFWACWMPHRRRTDGRGDARTAYRKHILDGADPQDILDGARGFLRSLTDAERPYIPLAASWLNKEAYADWAEDERNYQRRLAEIQARKQQPADVIQMRRPEPMSEEERQRREQVVRNSLRRLEG